MPVTVSWAKMESGFRIWIAGSMAAPPQRERPAVSMPGAMMQASSVRSGPIRSYVVAVPKSMTTAGPFAISYPATALTIRSGPVRDGLSVTTRMPVSDSGVTIRGSV